MRKRIFTVIAAILACAGITAQDAIYCAGHLQGDDWWGKKNVLKKTSEGIYQGEVHVRECTKFDSSDTTDPNNRSQFAFYQQKPNGDVDWDAQFWFSADNCFITPSCNETEYRVIKAGEGNFFECLGGVYNVTLNLNKMTAQFEPIAPVWLDYVVVSGTLDGENWVRPGGKYQLKHQGNGIYKGDIKLLDSGNGFGYLAIFASNLDWNNAKEGRYSYNDIQTPADGVAYTVSRYRGDNSIVLPPGEYAVTFDMDHNTAKFDVKSYDLKMSAAGYSTFYSQESAFAITGEVTAYAGLLNGNVLKLVPVADNRIPAGSAVIIKGEPGTAYTAVKTQEVATIPQNDLQGSDGTVVGNGSIYVLANKDNKIGFYLLNDGDKVPAGKAYLNNGANAKAIYFQDETTGILNRQAYVNEAKTIYNLSGQRIREMHKGINIVNGQKILY